jgi:glycerol-3-phosphate dehydrogenase
VKGVARLIETLKADYPFLDDRWAARLVRAYGTEAKAMLGDAASAADLGPDFGATLTGQEVRWLMDREYARRAEDVVWRRTKLGLRMSADQLAALDAWMAGHGPA